MGLRKGVRGLRELVTRNPHDGGDNAGDVASRKFERRGLVCFRAVTTHRANKRQWRIDLPSHDALEGLSQQERLEIIKRWDVHLKRHPAIRIMTVAVLLLSMAAGLFFNGPFTAWFQSLGLGRIVAHAIGASIPAVGVAIVGMTIGTWILWNIQSRAFRAALREIGRDVCVECGYWLRGLDDQVTQCPECGSAREAAGASTAVGDAP